MGIFKFVLIIPQAVPNLNSPRLMGRGSIGRSQTVPGEELKYIEFLVNYRECNVLPVITVIRLEKIIYYNRRLWGCHRKVTPGYVRHMRVTMTFTVSQLCQYQLYLLPRQSLPQNATRCDFADYLQLRIHAKRRLPPGSHMIWGASRRC